MFGVIFVIVLFWWVFCLFMFPPAPPAEKCLKHLIRSYCSPSLQACSKVLFSRIAGSLFQGICA